MRAWADEFDMAKSFSAEFLGDDLDAALFASYAFITDFLIFSAMAFIVFARTKDLFAE